MKILPDLSKLNPLKRNKPPSNYFLTLTIGREKADAVISLETLRRTKAIGHHKEYFGNDIEKIEDEPLLNILDKVISTAEKGLPSSIETQNTVFGVDPSWVESGKIKKDYLLRLKKISEELELKPVGFIVTTEAICHFLQKEEGAPVSAILTQIGKRYLTATLLQGGRIVESKSADIGDSPAQTLDVLLKHFSTPEVLPSRIIIFGENNEKINQQFIGFQWSKSLPFLHLPQITPLENSIDAKAVFYGAANQMNFVISDVSVIGGGNISEIPDIAENKPILNTDISEEKLENRNGESDFGFVEGKDVSPQTQKDDPTLAEKIQEIPENMQVRNSESKSLASNALLVFSGIKPAITKITRNIKVPAKFLPFPTGRGKFLIIPAVIIVLLLIFSTYYLLFRSATVTISVLAKSAQQTQDVVFGEDISTDAGAGTIHAKYISVSEDGKLSTPATGKKQTGDKAKGTVTLFNNNSSSKTLTAGTIISSSNNLDFTLDKSVTIASQSGDSFSGTKPGTSAVAVTASSFGTQYNLPSNTKFSVSGTDTIVAKNDDAFSGGTTKDITVVSSDDLNKLTSDMIKNLQDKAKADIGGKINPSEILLPQFVSTGFDNKSFSKKAGEEAGSVNLTATVVFKYITYSKDDLSKFAQNLFSNNSQNLKVNKDTITANAENLKIDKNNHTSAQLTITTTLLPNLNIQEISNAIVGKSFSETQGYISKIPQVSNVSISVSPNPLFLPKNLPSSPAKIKIVIDTNG